MIFQNNVSLHKYSRTRIDQFDKFLEWDLASICATL